MKTLTYTLSTTQNASTETRETLLEDLSGSHNVTFNFLNIDESESGVDRILATFYDDTEFVFHKNLTTNDSLSSVSFSKIIDTDFLPSCEKLVIFSLHRSDGITDTYTIDFTVYNSELDDYLDLNLIKTDFINTDGVNSLLMTFGADNPQIGGVSYTDLETTNFFGTTATTNTSAVTSEVGFVDEFDIVNSYRSHKEFIVERSGSIYNDINLKFQTRIGVGTSVVDYSNDSTVFVPASAGTQFLHTSGYLNWSCGETKSMKTINIPIVDIFGASLSIDQKVIVDVNGLQTLPLSTSYFLIDLYDLNACSSVTLGTSTLTAYIQY